MCVHDCVPVCVIKYVHSSSSRILLMGSPWTEGLLSSLSQGAWHREASDNSEGANGRSRMLGWVRSHSAAMATAAWSIQSSLGLVGELRGFTVIL